jgi:hypothetical protein
VVPQVAPETLPELLAEIFNQIATETVRLIPKLFIALIIIALTFLVIKALNFTFRKLLRFAKLDTTFKQLSGYTPPFSFDTVIVFLADLGVALIALYALVQLFLGVQYLQLMNEGLYYAARVVSIAVIAIVVLAVFNALIGRIKVESRLRSYTLFIVLLLVTAMLIDITALSDPVKNALITGLSVGVGISVGVFAIWFFFHEYLDRTFRTRTSASVEEDKQQSHKTGA